LQITGMVVTLIVLMGASRIHLPGGYYSGLPFWSSQSAA